MVPGPFLYVALVFIPGRRQQVCGGAGEAARVVRLSLGSGLGAELLVKAAGTRCLASLLTFPYAR